MLRINYDFWGGISGSDFANMLLGFGLETFPSLIDNKKGVAIESDFADRR